MRTDEHQVVIIGAGGHGRELYSYLRTLRSAGECVWLLGFIDENRPRGPWSGTEVLGSFTDLLALLDAEPDRTLRYITAVGSNTARVELVRKAEALARSNLRPWTLIHPCAEIGWNVEIGEGSCLAPGVILTTSVRVGQHCILNVKTSVSHDSVIGDFCNINPGAVISGNVRIGDGCFVGAGATVIENVTIGESAIIGAGAVVTGDIPAHVTAVGVPARVIKQRQRQDAR
jgi:sugar O-acyltransferase (sialic acid O-acetyltransferase NeuD family)